MSQKRIIALALAAVAACHAQDGDRGPRDFPGSGGGKEDAFGRSLVGVAAPYEPNPELLNPAAEERLRSDMQWRRTIAWQTAYQALDQVPLYGLAEAIEQNDELVWPEGEIPRIPRFQTWYGVDEIKQMFQHLYEQLGASGRAIRADFDAAAVDEAFEWNARSIDRSSRWPLERYLRYVGQLGECPEGLDPIACATHIQSGSAGAAGGISRITYSPATVRHLLNSYQRIYDCLAELDSLGFGREPTSETNFTACLESEMPADAVLVKAQWVRADFGQTLPTYDTDADAMKVLLGEGSTSHWGETGDRQTSPDASQIYTVRLQNGSVFRLAGLHLMTKELRHWQWLSLWWSDRPDEDFGADRPEPGARSIDPVWNNYKMCAASWYDELDPAPESGFESEPSLAQALAAVSAAAEGSSWCSNPYIERGRHNARTNCIGCHQHGGSSVGPDVDGDGTLDPFDLEAVISDERSFPRTSRAQIREIFPADYLWSFNRVDDVSGVLAHEIEFFDRADTDSVTPRITAILARTGDEGAGGATFAERCAPCHGADGSGSGWAPSLIERLPSRPDDSVLRTLIQGRGGMPAWGEVLDDRALADLLAYLRATF